MEKANVLEKEKESMEYPQDKYIVVYDKEEFAEQKTIEFFDSKGEMNKLIEKLYRSKTKTKLSLAYFADVYPKGVLYPDTYEGLWDRREQANRKMFSVVADFFVQYETTGGKVVQKYYGFPEDFDWELEEWKEKGYKNIIILDENESVDGEQYYKSEIAKLWGEMHEPIID